MSRQYNMAEWAEHYTRRANGAQHDADKARRLGLTADADKLQSIADAYRSDATRCARMAERLDDHKRAYGRQHRDTE